MPAAKDTLLRQLALLRMIPILPRRIATTTLKEKLHEQGFVVDLRTVQRDLNRLSLSFSLLCDDGQSPHRWSYLPGSVADFDDMDPPTALALCLAQHHLKCLLPQSVLSLLSPSFDKARNYLDGLGHNDLSHWARRVRTVPNGKALIPAPIDPSIWEQVSAALLGQRQLRVRYHSRSKRESRERCLNPAGFVSRHSISYLLATDDGKDTLLQFALHRIQQAQCLESPAQLPVDLDLDGYLDGGGFNSSGPVPRVELVADVTSNIAGLLQETPLSHVQRLEPTTDPAWQRLHAEVPQDNETLWWIFALNQNIRVHEPQAWVEQVKANASRLSEMYA